MSSSLSAKPRRLPMWVPIRPLAERHRQRILSHLRGLSPSDRYLRFGHAATDAQIADYVARLDFHHDELFGIVNRRLELIAVAHLAFSRGGHSSEPEPSQVAEFGVSVAQKARGRGYGSLLFDHACRAARNRGVDTLVIHALSENAPMLKIARQAGAIVHRAGPDAEAVLRLPPDDLASHMGEWFERLAADFDYRWKRQLLRG
jgi:GNAT superfamily N-acetyltransferase